jgi:hypothetical protein
MQTDRALTPYDTGVRLEPRLWRPDPTDHDSYGRVDFENDESTTEMTVYVEWVAGVYQLRVDNHTGNPIEVTVSD